MEKASAKGGVGSVKSSRISRVSYRSKQSMRSQARVASGEVDFLPPGTAIPEEEGLEEEEELEARPEDFVNCNNCLRPLTDDEKIINARFVNEAMAASRDISLFPICIACNFENLEQQVRDTKQRDKKYASMKETKGVFFPSNKKLYEANMHKNSEEFKQLGTMHIENRSADYFPLEKPQPTAVKESPLAAIKMERMVAGSASAAARNAAHAYSRTQSLDKNGDADKTRSAHIKSLISDRMKEEEIRNRLIADEIVKMKRSGPRASSAARRHTDTLFPTTTNQETHNTE